MHSSEYRDPTQLRAGRRAPRGRRQLRSRHRDGDVRNAPDLALRPRQGTGAVSHREPAEAPVLPVLWFVASRVLTVRTPIGRKVRPHVISGGAPRIRVKTNDLRKAGVESVPRTVGAQGGLPALEDGRVLDVANVIWCTGFRQDFSWIDLPVFEGGSPVHERGVARTRPLLRRSGLPTRVHVGERRWRRARRAAHRQAPRVAATQEAVTILAKRGSSRIGARSPSSRAYSARDGESARAARRCSSAASVSPSCASAQARL